MWSGKYSQALTLLAASTRPESRNSLIEILAIEGAANARLHQFTVAEEKLGQATLMCRQSPEVACGDAVRAQGVLAVQRGEIDAAKHFFEKSLEFARVHHNQLLEVTALLNLGLTSLRQEHFDEAIGWTDGAYQASIAIGSDDIAQNALGNLSWAYYNLGDAEKSLDLALEAERRATRVGDVIDQMSWTTNAGYVYASLGDPVRAKQSYLQALNLAGSLGSKQGIYNSLRALALVSVQTGDLGQARQYADDAIAIARADNNRLDELYPLLAKGLISSHSHEDAQAAKVFLEIDQDANANASLRWRSEHALAQLYEDENRTNAADREYRAALATFEAARSTLRRNDSRLPFSNNASRIYDDYIHFLIARGKTGEALRWADFSRARTLSEGLGSITNIPRTGPPTLNPRQIARQAKGTILFYWLGKKQSYLWVITAKQTSLFTLPPGAQIDAVLQRYRKGLAGPQDVLASADADGQSLYRMLVAPAEALLDEGAKVFVIPDGNLNNLNFETLLVPSPSAANAPGPKSDSKPHFWIEDVTLANASSLRILNQPNAAKKKSNRDLLLVGNSVAPNDKYPELAKATAQMESIAAHFTDARRKILARENATPASYLAGNPERFSYIHFVAHGTASRLSPLDSAIVLSKASAEDDSFKLYARDIIRFPLQAELVTISACYGAGERSYAGEGLVGLSWAFLRAGAHNVIAALWEASDAPTELLMDNFYSELNKGAPPDTALRAAKLALLRSGNFRNPFYWAPFQLYTRGG